MKKWGTSNGCPSDAIPPSEWLEHFKKLFTQTQPSSPLLLEELARLEKEAYYSDLDFRITQEEILL